MEIYTTNAAWAAQMLRDLLEQNGITAHVRETSTGFYRQPQFIVLIADPADEARARDVAAGFREDASAEPLDPRSVWPWRCGQCREDVEPQFEVCWSCGAPKPDRE